MTTSSERPELLLGNAALGFLGVLAIPVLAVAGLVTGWPGSVAAAGGIGLVAILFGATGVMQAWAASRGLATLARVTWAGVGVRLVAYATGLSLMGRIEWLHRPSLAITTGVAFTATLGYEMWLISRTPGLFWVRVADNDAQRSNA